MFKKVLAMLAGGCMCAVAGAAMAEPFKVGLITPSPISDVGWAKQLDLGLEAIKEECGPNIETVAVDKIEEGPGVARVINQMVSDGTDLVITGSFGYMKTGLRVARQHPDVDFINGSGNKRRKNFGTFTARNYEGAYLAGLAAGMVTESDTIGVVGAFPVPEVVADTNALAIAAKKVNPDAEVRVIWVNSWFDPSRAQNAARALVSQGADVLFSLNQDTPSVVNVAAAEDVYVVNTASDMSKYGPEAVLVSITDDWTGYFVDKCKASRNGDFEGSVDHLGIGDGVVTMASWNDDLSEDQLAQIEQARKDIASGDMHIFSGPLKDQKGNVRVKEGEHLPDPKIFNMHWLLQGIRGSISD